MIHLSERWSGQMSEIKITVTQSDLQAAAKHGQLYMVEWLHQRGCPWDVSVCASAAGHGHLAVLQFLHQHGCPWSEWSTAYAAQSGHLDILQYLHQHGCPW